MRRQRGFTMVEAMIALAISAMLVGMILAVFSRMSVAFRTQQNVAELQQILAAAHEQIGRDVRQAGFGIPHGFFVAGDQLLHSPVQIDNDAGFGPDQLRVFAADASSQARVTAVSTNPADAFGTLDVDAADTFAAGDVAVITAVNGDPLAMVPWTYRACVVQIEAIAGATFTLDHAGTFGSADNDQCDDVRANFGNAGFSLMIYRFHARAYRIDPARRALAILQVSPSGGLAVGDWQDLGVGFTDLQIASRWHQPGDAVAEDDGDNDATREWFSGVQQEELTVSLAAAAAPYNLMSYRDANNAGVHTRPAPLELRVSLALRTHTRVDTVPSARTPRFTDPARPTTNSIGDRDAIELEGVSDTLRPLELRGDHVYRYATVGTDLRNLGVGR